MIVYIYLYRERMYNYDENDIHLQCERFNIDSLVLASLLQNTLLFNSNHSSDFKPRTHRL